MKLHMKLQLKFNVLCVKLVNKLASYMIIPYLCKFLNKAIFAIFMDNLQKVIFKNNLTYEALHSYDKK